MSGAIHSLPQYDFMAWCLLKHRDNFTFYLCRINFITEYAENLFNYECCEYCIIEHFAKATGLSNCTDVNPHGCRF
jgi:hypothetical protein